MHTSLTAISVQGLYSTDVLTQVLREHLKQQSSEILLSTSPSDMARALSVFMS